MTQGFRIGITVMACLLAGPRVGDIGASHPAAQGLDARQPPSRRAGQSATLLPDGTWLLIGGQGTRQPVATASIWDPSTGTMTPIRSGLEHARADHTATLLPDGRVLILGGIGSQGTIEATAERFDPQSQRFQTVTVPVEPRAFHSATLLTEGRLLIVGGVGADGQIRASAEVWDPASATVADPIPMRAPRRGHTATLLDDGSIAIVGGMGGDGQPAVAGEIYYPATESFAVGVSVPMAPNVTFLAGSRPENGATDVPVNTSIALRFSERVRVTTLTPRTVGLAGPDGGVRATVTPAEEGRLAFLTPTSPLSPGATYTIAVNGVLATDAQGTALPPTSLTFTTAAEERTPKAIADDEAWTPGPDAVQRGWRSGRADSPWQQLPPLLAPPGVTALSGQALLLNGKPLADVTMEVDGHTVRTDRSGRFLLLLPGMASGREELDIDGTTANRPGKTYGVFEAGVRIVANTTMALPYTIWMPKIDTAHAVTIPSPTTQETVVTTPFIPGLELHLAPGTVIRGEDGQVVHQLSITPIPIDRPPFPLPQNTEVPIYFTIQPGGAYVHVYGRSDVKGARLVYPNYTHQKPGTRMDFWHYDPESPRGWNVYGQGSVNTAAAQVVPDAGVSIYAFTGAMISGGGSPPAAGPAPGGGPDGGDPVDLGTGLFVYQKTDIYLPDVIPISLKRTYRPGDSTSRAFGIGATNPYAMTLYSTQNYEWADLILPDGGRIHYVRISPGTGFVDAEYEHTTTPSLFYKSHLTWNQADLGWNVRLKDGTVYVFGDSAPLREIRDRFGNTLRIEHSGPLDAGNITKVTSPHNRWVSFTYDGSNRVTQATDNIGRSVGYTYDGSGRLWKVTDAAGGITEYTYDSSHRMLTIKDPRGIVYLTNTYDSNGRVSQQTQADGGIFEFDYTLSSGKVTQTDVTDPEGHVQRTTFNADGYALTHVEALGTALARTTTFTRASGSNLLTSTEDGLSRETQYAYDSNGNLTSIIRLPGTVNETTTTFTYEFSFNQVATVTDRLNHTTTLTYDSAGHLTAATDPLNHTTTLTYNPAGQPATVTDALGHTMSFSYEMGDLTAIASPLSDTATRFFDGAGRILRQTDPLQRSTVFAYSALNQVTQVTDPLGGQASYTYDGNGNLLTLTDARGKSTAWTYDNMNQVATRTDALSRQESFAYNLDGLLTSSTDRKSQVTTQTYDALHRQVFIGFEATGTPPTYASTISTTYDDGDRATEIVDSAAGTITRTYDLDDQITQEVTPEGTIDYTYDIAGRPYSMTVDGQATVSYTHDDANRLIEITQGSAEVSIGYDSVNRRTSLTLPNGVTVNYSYDDASQLTGLTYKLLGTTFGAITYAYDAASRRTSVTGTYARTGLPAALPSATYDDANQIATWGGTSLSHDSNGNLTSDGARTYSWNARNELTGIGGSGSAAFAYDAFGRRRAKTVSGTTTQFLYDGLTPVQELQSGSPVTNFVAGLSLDEFFTRTDSLTTRHYVPDALGNTIALTDGAGAVQTEYTYDPFGGTVATGAATGNAFGFTGREIDGTGLLFFRARYYDPGLQRFIAEDPAVADANLFTYVSNQPTRFIDPLGLGPAPPGPPPFPLPPGKNGLPNEWRQNPANGRYEPRYPINVDGDGGQPNSSWDGEDGWWRYNDGKGGK